jgi:TRAP-type transport system periplasmic protein
MRSEVTAGHHVRPGVPPKLHFQGGHHVAGNTPKRTFSSFLFSDTTALSTHPFIEEGKMKTAGLRTASAWVITLALVIGLAGISDAQTYKARLSYHWFPSHGCAIFSEAFAQRVKEKTNGKVEIATFGSAQLYSLQEIVTAISTGAVDFGGVVDTSFVAVDPNIGISMMPYYWEGFEGIRKLWEETPAGKQHWEGLQKKLNIKILAYIPTGPVMLFSSNKLIDEPKDAKGLKARYLAKSEIPVYEAMGATPVFVQTTEIYTALQSGMVDMVPTVLNAIKAYNWWDYLKIGIKPYMYFWDSYIVVNATWWNKLPEDLRNTIVTEVCTPMSKEATEAVMLNSEKTIAEWQKAHGGKAVQLTREQHDAYKNLFRTKVWPSQVEKMDPAVVAAAEKITGVPIK